MAVLPVFGFTALSAKYPKNNLKSNECLRPVCIVPVSPQEDRGASLLQLQHSCTPVYQFFLIEIPLPRNKFKVIPYLMTKKQRELYFIALVPVKRDTAMLFNLLCVTVAENPCHVLFCSTLYSWIWHWKSNPDNRQVYWERGLWCLILQSRMWFFLANFKHRTDLLDKMKFVLQKHICSNKVRMQAS